MYVKDIMILEGDWTNKELLPYFEGIKSVSENESNIIKLNTISHNIFDGDKLFPSIIKNGSMFNGLKFIQLNKSSFGFKGTVTAQPTVLFENMQSCLVDGKTYTVSGNYVRFEITYYDGTKSWPKSFVYNQSTISSVKVYFQLGTSSVGNYYDEVVYIQVEDGNQTDYKECKSDSLQLQLTAPLRSLPNGVVDTIDYEKGIITRNVGKVVLNGSESWIVEGVDVGNFISIPAPMFAVRSPIISDRFVETIIAAASTENIIGIMTTDGPSVRLRIKFKDTNCTLEEGKAWLQSNPVTVYYQLANPTTEQVDNKATIQTFKDGYIQLENSITPIVNLDFSTNYPSIVANMKEKLDALMDRMATVEAYITAQAAASVLNNI